MRLAMPMYETEVLRYRENKKRGHKKLYWFYCTIDCLKCQVGV